MHLLLTALYRDGGSAGAERARRLAAAAAENGWSFLQYEREFTRMAELSFLLETPYMINIIVIIMPQLARLAAGPAVVKRELLALCGRHHGELLFGQLRAARLVELERLGEVQALIDAEGGSGGGGDDDDDGAGGAGAGIGLDLDATLTTVVHNALPEEAPRTAEFKALLRRCLRRRPVTRAAVYETFLAHLVEREVQKQRSARRDYTGDAADLTADVYALCERLAVHMTSKNMSKVVCRRRR